MIILLMLYTNNITKFLKGYSFNDEKEILYLKNIWFQNETVVRVLTVIQLLHFIYFASYSFALQAIVFYSGFALFGVFLPTTIIILLLCFLKNKPTSSYNLRQFWYLMITFNSFMMAVAITLKNLLCLYNLQPKFACITSNRPGLLAFEIYALIGPILGLLVFRCSRYFIAIGMVISVVFETTISFYTADIASTIIVLIFQLGSYSFWLYLSYNQECSERDNFILQYNLKQQIETTKNLMIREREMDNKRTQFTSYIFHEVRVPLNTVVLNLNLMENDEPFMSKFTKDDLEYVDRLKSGLASIENILNDALDFRKMSEGKFQITLRPYNVITCSKNLIWSMRNSWISKMIMLKTEIDPDFENLRFLLIGDELRLRQILSNLLSNAIKFCNTNGMINIRIKKSGHPYSFSELSGGETINIYFEIEDTGIGISEDDQKLLFQPYVQVKSSVYRQGAGTGLGLSICAHLIGMFKGTYGVRSKLGVGSTFWMNIPFKISDLLDNSPAHVELTKVNITQPRHSLHILICDDDSLTRKLMGKIMKKLGHTFDTAVDGNDAVLKVQQAKSTDLFYDILFMDNQMPNLSGKEAILEMRRIGFTVPIVTITGDAQIQDQEELIRAGSNYVMTKPCTMDKIQKIIRILPINKL
jgi:signal transduction histidine kinase/CheY-like chemotaxis protein